MIDIVCEVMFYNTRMNTKHQQINKQYNVTKKRYPGNTNVNMHIVQIIGSAKQWVF